MKKTLIGLLFTAALYSSVGFSSESNMSANQEFSHTITETMINSDFTTAMKQVSLLQLKIEGFNSMELWLVRKDLNIELEKIISSTKETLNNTLSTSDLNLEVIHRTMTDAISIRYMNLMYRRLPKMKKILDRLLMKAYESLLKGKDLQIKTVKKVTLTDSEYRLFTLTHDSVREKFENLKNLIHLSDNYVENLKNILTTRMT